MISEESRKNNIFNEFDMDYFAYRYIKYWIGAIILFSFIFCIYYVTYYNYYKLDCGSDLGFNQMPPLYNFNN